MVSPKKTQSYVKHSNVKTVILGSFAAVLKKISGTAGKCCVNTCIIPECEWHNNNFYAGLVFECERAGIWISGGKWERVIQLEKL